MSDLVVVVAVSPIDLEIPCLTFPNWLDAVAYLEKHLPEGSWYKSVDGVKRRIHFDKNHLTEVIPGTARPGKFYPRLNFKVKENSLGSFSAYPDDHGVVYAPFFDGVPMKDHTGPRLTVDIAAMEARVMERFEEEAKNPEAWEYRVEVADLVQGSHDAVSIFVEGNIDRMCRYNYFFTSYYGCRVGAGCFAFEIRSVSHATPFTSFNLD